MKLSICECKEVRDYEKSKVAFVGNKYCNIICFVFCSAFYFVCNDADSCLKPQKIRFPPSFC
jgi:hypothetical protein